MSTDTEWSIHPGMGENRWLYEIRGGRVMGGVMTGVRLGTRAEVEAYVAAIVRRLDLADPAEAFPRHACLVGP